MIPALQETVRYILYLFRNLSGLWKKVDNDFSACSLNDTVVILVQGYTLSYYAIGASFFGTWTAALAFYTKPGRQMTPGSDFVQANSKEKGFLDRIISIRAQSDQFVKPRRSAYLPGARNIELALVGHTTLLESKEVLDIIEEELANIRQSPGV